ncbi:hypothetical protein [Kitasatospora sp. NPDC088548]|uniref:hypothetical protein n=1 Tax=Kitasatospora sp. NPDC088548 TaxID=3364075 RepID=UPI00382F9006
MTLGTAARLNASNITDAQLDQLQGQVQQLLGLLAAKDRTDAKMELTVELPTAKAEWLLRTALERGTTASAVIAEAIEQIRTGRPAPQQMIDPQADGKEWFNVQQLAELSEMSTSRVYAAVGTPTGPNPVRTGPNGGRILVHRIEAVRWARINGVPVED